MSVKTVFSFFLSLIFLSGFAATLIFDPAGDAKHPGRLIGSDRKVHDCEVNGRKVQTFERTATLYLARKIKDHIATLDKKTIVLFSRLPGEHKDPIEKMRFVQQCDPDLFVHVSLYHSPHIKPQIHFYYHAQNNLPAGPQKLLTPIAHAHTAYTSRSQELVHKIYTSLQTGTERICDLHAPISIPCCALSGIPAPACIIEIGVKDTDDLYNCIAPLAESILYACTGRRS